ncbi:MAG: hypothetical protein DI598_01100 [Pseudopedobacter saltans]|uniref:Lipoprotein n=1 Tax=Pseudopedobacter saltans TaxID=151895 RepID=A0A2W5FBE5_9SPHI|nr:MAG: hypothetical protein DI598_01100 [Pseudopedobacter saltans]
MKKLTTYVLSSFAIAVIFWSFSSCKENGQSHETKTENVERTADIPKDTLIKIIRTLADYIVSPNPTDSGLGKTIEPYQKRFIIGFNTNIFNDTISQIHIGGNFDDKIGMGKSIGMSSIDKDSIKWLTFSDLTKAFGGKEEGVFDKKRPLPKEPGYYVIYTVSTSNGLPAYLCVHADYLSQNENQFLINTLELKKEKHFYPLGNS